MFFNYVGSIRLGESSTYIHTLVSSNNHLLINGKPIEVHCLKNPLYYPKILEVVGLLLTVLIMTRVYKAAGTDREESDAGVWEDLWDGLILIEKTSTI